MRRLALLLLLAAAAADLDPVADSLNNDDIAKTLLANDTVLIDNDNGTVSFRDVNGTVIELDADQAEVVRKKRTFGDVVFRGLADVLGYSVQRKPPQVAFPPPLPPVPGIDTPLAVAAPPAPAPAAATAPCGAPRAAGPPPCARPPPPPPPPAPKAVPPCPRPRAAPRRKPKKTPPPPPPPPPCAQPRANPSTPAPCAPPPPPPPKQADNLDRITSNLRLSFNFNRSPVTPAPVAPAAPPAPPTAEEIAQAEAEAGLLDDEDQYVPIVPQAAKLPATEPRQPRVYVDAFVVQNGVARRVDTVDAKRFSPQQASADEDYLAYDDENQNQQPLYDDYEDAQESRDREAAVRQFGTAVDAFWQNKREQAQQNQKQRKQRKPKRLPANHYQNVHFGDRIPAEELNQREGTHQNLQRERARPNRIPVPVPESDDEDAESTTTTEDPRKPLKPRVLPPTEHNPNQIDTVTVRVPPIYKEKRPKKLHRPRQEQPDRDEDNEGDDYNNRTDYNNEADYNNREDYNGRTDKYNSGENAQDADGHDSAPAPQTERPRRKRRRKQSRKTRSVAEEADEDDDEDGYYGKKYPVSKEEKFYLSLTVPTPTVDSDVARHQAPVKSGYFLEDYERLREDPREKKFSLEDHERITDDTNERIRDAPDDDEDRADEKERSDDDGRADERERSVEDTERAGEEDRADERERSDKLSPNARVRETGYQNNYVRAHNVQVDDPRPKLASVKRKTVKIGSA